MNTPTPIKQVRKTPAQKKAYEHYQFCVRQEDRLGGSVFANSFNTRQARERTHAAFLECKRLGMGIEHGL